MQSERRSPASRLHSSAPLHIIRRFTQYFRNDFVGLEQWSRFITDGQYAHRPALHRQQQEFAKLWDDNLGAQGFAVVFEPKKHIHD